MPKPKKSASAPTPPPKMVVLTTRITVAERDQVRQAAGWGGLQMFVHDAVMAAVKKARKTR